MARRDDILVIARAAIAEFGSDAPDILEKRANEHARAGEIEGNEVWRDVADAVRKIQNVPTPIAGS